MKRAVVIGASIAGLLSARVLSEHFDCVNILEKDDLKDELPRKGVPQGHHIHILWSGGMAAMRNLFPGVEEDLRRQGGIVYDNSKDMRWYHHGVWKLRTDSGLKIHSQSRPLLERIIRDRVMAIENVKLIPRSTLKSLAIDKLNNRITGVEFTERSVSDASKTLEADLVIDASGRTGAALRCLADHGYPPPEVDKIRFDIGYASRIYKKPENTNHNWQSLVIYPKAPLSFLWGVIFPIEGDRWIVTLVGVAGHHLKTNDPEAFVKFASQLDQPELYEAIRDATPLSPVRLVHFPGQQRRRLERMHSLPGGLLAVGDALCSFNPLYGQGMTVCSLEASLLKDCLESNSSSECDKHFGNHYFKKASRIINPAWFLSTNNDFLYPNAEGKRMLGNKVISWYLRRILHLSANSPVILIRFLQVLHFVKPLSSLMFPDVLFRVLLLKSKTQE